MPQRGDKKRLIDRIIATAREALGRRLAESASQRQLLDGVAAAFGIDGPLHRIEVYDNSHIQGTNAVGAMIVAGPEGLVKNAYRKFTIRGVRSGPGGRCPTPAALGPLSRTAGERDRAPQGWVGEGSEAGDGSPAATIMR